jgi:hypothetical protein
MRWFVSIDGKTSGPHGEETLAKWAAAGRLPLSAHVQGELGGAWMPLPESPLASLVAKDIERERATAERGFWGRFLLMLLVFGGLWFASCASLARIGGCGR